MMTGKTRSLHQSMVVALLTLLAGGVCFAASSSIPVASLADGYHLMYNLDFADAHQIFLNWQQQHPDDPLGPASDAAGLIFSELHRLGVLEAQFYTDDKAFDKREKLSPDPVIKERFNAALNLAEIRARARLEKDPKDRDGLLAIAANGFTAGILDAICRGCACRKKQQRNDQHRFHFESP